LKNKTTKQYKTYENLAKILGFSGLIPFIIAFITLNFNVSKIQVLEIIIVYGYTIIAFLGGIYWGIGLNIKVGAKKYFFISTLPSIFVLISLLFPLSLISKIIYLICILNFFLYLEFSFLQTFKLPKWFFFLRIKLNIFLTLLLILIALSAYLSI
tara:strand:- start:201 stop:665 length:465 start_codon:yes stop_codon:yes gene_type:complete